MASFAPNSIKKKPYMVIYVPSINFSVEFKHVGKAHYYYLTYLLFSFFYSIPKIPHITVAGFPSCKLFHYCDYQKGRVSNV